MDKEQELKNFVEVVSFELVFILFQSIDTFNDKLLKI